MLKCIFLWKEYWTGFPFPSPGAFPNSGIKPMSLAFPALAGRIFTTEPPRKPQVFNNVILNYLRVVMMSIFVVQVHIAVPLLSITPGENI